MSTDTDRPADGAPANGNPRRRVALTVLATVVALAGLGWGAYEWLVASRYESTDNAYVQGNVVQITPQIGGTVLAIHADDTDFVKAGQPLVQLDPADVKVALEQAEANLAQTVRQVRTLYLNNGSLAAQVRLREADIAKAEAEVARAADDLSRRQALAFQFWLDRLQALDLIAWVREPGAIHLTVSRRARQLVAPVLSRASP